MSRSSPIWRLRARRSLFVAALVLSAWLAFGISAADEAAVRAFGEETHHWQTNPEFRTIAFEYCVLGSRALRTRPFLLRAGGVVLGMRSVPFLPRRFAVNATSGAHYENFAKGPLSAYLYLCGEQSVPVFAGVLEGTSGPGQNSDVVAQRFLDSFHMDFPVRKDAGAIQSVHSMLKDAAPQRAFTVRENVGPLLLPHVRAVARGLRVPEDPQAMSPEQQRAVLERLDARVRQDDPELWRTKQLSDFCGGVWAQVFGPSYRLIIWPLLVLHLAGKLSLALLLLWAVFRHRRRSVPAG